MRGFTKSHSSGLSTPRFASAWVHAPSKATIRSYTLSDHPNEDEHGKTNAANHVLKIMPIGGSITYGQGSTNGNGYRDKLRRMLTSAGYHVDMVGSRKTGTVQDNDHEGWRGFRIDQIINKARLSLPKHKADVFLVNAGANDYLQNFDLTTAGDRMQSLLNVIWEICPASTILLSTLLVNAHKETDSHAAFVNQCFRNLVEENIRQRRRLVLVEMRSSEGPQLHQLIDGTHPDDAGYERMATLWYQAFIKLSTRA